MANKIKSHKGASKRFKKTANGFKHRQAMRGHILTKKSTKTKRHLRGAANVHETNMGHIAAMLPFAGL